MPLTRWDSCFLCHELFLEVHDYMVHDSVWIEEAVIHKYAGVCHLLCLETRLERSMILDDFPIVPVNREIRRGDRKAWVICP